MEQRKMNKEKSLETQSICRNYARINSFLMSVNVGCSWWHRNPICRSFMFKIQIWTYPTNGAVFVAIRWCFSCFTTFVGWESCTEIFPMNPSSPLSIAVTLLSFIENHIKIRKERPIEIFITFVGKGNLLSFCSQPLPSCSKYC